MRPPIWLAALLAVASPALADDLPVRAARLVEYRIQATLDAGRKTLAGQQRLVWHNPAPEPVPDLWFHLYLNAFRNSNSTFYRESGGRLRNDQMPEDGWGWIDVTALRLADGTDLLPSMSFEHPDDDNAEDRTVARVTLPSPVGPGESVALDITFEAQLPRLFARTGYHRDFYLVGQWFPKLGVYEPAGTRGRVTGGWNCHQFHANSEFYADYGYYLVDLTVPAGFVVGATGQRIQSADNGDGTVTHRYEQADVHDFAWTADPNYIEIRETFSATADVTEEEYRSAAALLGRSDEQMRLSDVDIIVLMQPARRRQADRYIRAAKLGLKWFGLWYGRYPYPTLTIVDPAFGGGGAAGMEYPTFITAGTAWPLGYWPLSGVRGAEEVTVHEFGHQYWYGLVGSNEFEEAWLDEGFTSYSSGKVMELAGAGRIGTLAGLQMDRLDLMRSGYSPQAKYDRVRQPAWTYSTLNAYGFYSYGKPELLLRTLEYYLGERTMARILRTYHERWRFRHPSSDDFYAVANEVAGQDLSWFFGQAVESPDLLDYAITMVSTRPVEAPRGRLEASVAPDEAAAEAEAPQTLYESHVLVRRVGEFVFPVEIAVKFEGREPERVRWDGQDRWKRLTFVRPERLEWVDVDPDRRVLLDVDWLNNARRVTPDPRVAWRWSTRVMFWVQNLLATIGW